MGETDDHILACFIQMVLPEPTSETGRSIRGRNRLRFLVELSRNLGQNKQDGLLEVWLHKKTERFYVFDNTCILIDENSTVEITFWFYLYL